MTDIDQAFYNLTVAQRDAAWREVKVLGTKLSAARKEIAELLPALDADAFTIGNLNQALIDRERRMGIMWAALKEISDSYDCDDDTCTVDDPHCVGRTAEAAMREVGECAPKG